MERIILRALALVAAAALMAALAGRAGDVAAQSSSDGWTAEERIQWGIPEDLAPDPETGAFGHRPPGLEADKIVFFNGKSRDCKNLLGGALKCCKEPVPDQQAVWWKQYQDNTRQSVAEQLACQAAPNSGAWASLDGGADYTDLQRALTSERENLAGGGQPIQCSSGSSVETTQNEFMEYANTEVKPRLGWYCDDGEFELAVQRNVGQCSYVGTRCVTKILGFCLVEKEVYCCFNSPVSRMIREQLMPDGSMGTAKSPMCQGISAAQVDSLDFNRFDTDELEARMVQGGFLVQPGNPGLEAQLTGSGSAMGNQLRQTLTTRTGERFDEIEYEDAITSIEDSLAPTLPTTAAPDPGGPGTVSIGAASLPSVSCNSTITVPIVRTGGEGSVSVRVQSTPWTYQAPFVSTVDEVLTWGHGDTSTKSVAVRIGEFTPGYENIHVQFWLTAISPGVVIDPYNDIWVEARRCW